MFFLIKIAIQWFKASRSKNNSDEGLPAVPSLETKIPEPSVEDPKVVSENINSNKSTRKVKFKQKDDVSHKKEAAATHKNNNTKITQFFSSKVTAS